jgi:hypothetical protein
VGIRARISWMQPASAQPTAARPMERILNTSVALSAHMIEKMAMEHALRRSTQLGRDHDSVRRSGVRRLALKCLAALGSTGVWAAILWLCSWLVELPIRPVVLVGILTAAFLLQLLALSLIAGAFGGPN